MVSTSIPISIDLFASADFEYTLDDLMIFWLEGPIGHRIRTRFNPARLP